eukprot:6459933-Amphidinium_carterae.2
MDAACVVQAREAAFVPRDCTINGLVWFACVCERIIWRIALVVLPTSYQDVCRPQWLHRDPELFYGFWGTCYNDYRDTEPHDGYEIVRRSA